MSISDEWSIVSVKLPFQNIVASTTTAKIVIIIRDIASCAFLMFSFASSSSLSTSLQRTFANHFPANITAKTVKVIRTIDAQVLFSTFAYSVAVINISAIRIVIHVLNLLLLYAIVHCVKNQGKERVLKLCVHRKILNNHVHFFC